MPAGGRASSAVNICQAPSSAFPSRAPLSAARSLSALRFSEARHESRKLIMLSHLKYPWPGLDRMVCVTGGRSSLLKRCARSLARSLSPGEGPVSWTGPQAGVTRLPTVANGRESLMSAGRNEDVPLEKYRRPAPPPTHHPPRLLSSCPSPTFSAASSVFQALRRANDFTPQAGAAARRRLPGLSGITRCQIRIRGV